MSLLHVSMVQFKVRVGNGSLGIMRGDPCGLGHYATNMHNHPALKMRKLRLRGG